MVGVIGSLETVDKCRESVCILKFYLILGLIFGQMYNQTNLATIKVSLQPADTGDGTKSCAYVCVNACINWSE